MNVSTKFDIYPMSGLSGNVRKPKCDGQTDGRTDGRTDKTIPIVPLPNSVGGGQI